MADFIDGPRDPSSPPIPGWDSIIHLKPQHRFTREENAEIRAADRDHRPPQISDDALAALQRRRDLADQYASSQIPEWRQKLIRTLTTLDNIQDQVSTIAWLTGPILDRMGSKGKIIHYTAEATGDAINFTMAALRGPTPGRAAKARRAITRTANARTTGGIVGMLQKGVGWIQKNQGHLIEASQATDTWFGVGLSLGAIFGALEETYARTGKQAYDIAMTGLNYAIGTFGDLSPQGRAAALQAADRYAAAGIDDPLPPPFQLVDWLAEQIKFTSTEGKLYDSMTHAIEAVLGPADLTPAELAMLGLANATTTTRHAAAFSEISSVLTDDEIANLSMPAPRVLNPVTRHVLETNGATFDPRGRATDTWRETDRSFQQHVDDSLTRLRARPDTWLPAAAPDPRSQIPQQLVEASMAPAADLLTGSAQGIYTVNAPDDALIYAAIDQGVTIPADADRVDVADWFSTMISDLASNADAWIRDGLKRRSDEYWSTPAGQRAAARELRAQEQLRASRRAP